ncbi:MAG: tetratricopeptide repeat protein [Bacteroidota bacterium]
MKKQCFLMTVFILASVAVYAQFNNPSYTRTAVVASPEIYGNQNLAYLVKGDNFMTTGQFEEAVRAYDNAIEFDPFFAEAYVKRGLMKYKMGRVKEAEADFNKANFINPYALDLYGAKTSRNKLRVLAFNPYQWLTDLSLSERLEYYEEYYEDRQIIGDLELELSLIANSYYEQALEMLEEKLENNNAQTAAIYDLMGLVHLMNGEASRAMNAFELAIKLDEKFALAYYNASLAQVEQENYMSALEYVEESIALAPNIYKAYFQRAKVLKLLGQYDDAMKDYELFNQNNLGEGLMIRLNQAITQKLSGDAAGAVQEFNDLIEESAEENPTLYKLRGNANMLLGEYQYAINDYNRAILLNENFAEAYFNRGLARIMLYNRPDGCLDLERGVELGYEEGEERRQLFCNF